LRLKVRKRYSNESNTWAAGIPTDQVKGELMQVLPVWIVISIDGCA
jgi:hypothetical protein